MAKPRTRKLKDTDRELTEYLDIEELAAIGGDKYHIKAMGKDKTVPACIECGGPTENHGRFDKVLIDIVQVDRQKQFARLQYYFYKYRCLNAVEGHENCNTLFQKRMGFVSSENTKITRRYEDEIMRLAMYESLTDVRNDMKPYIVKGHNKDLISKPAMSKVIKRWVEERDDRRSFGSPVALCFYTYKSIYNDFIVVGDLSKKNCRVIEVIPKFSESTLRAFLTKIDLGGLRAAIVDCNETLCETIKDYVPDDRVMMDTDALRHILREEFKSYIYKRLINYQKSIRNAFLARPDKQSTITGKQSRKMRILLKEDPELERVYSSYSSLYALLQKRRDVSEINQWMEVLNREDADHFLVTITYIKMYYQEFARFQSGISQDTEESLYDEIYSINKKIDTHFPISTDEVFRARMLYSDFSKIGDKKWQGIDVSDLRDIIDNMIKTGGLEKHER